MAARIGIEIDEQFNESLKGIGRAESLERILVHGGKAAEFGAQDRERLASEKNAAYLASLAELGEKDTLPGIKQLLLDLRSHGVRVALASASKNAETILNALRVRDLIEAIADPAAVKHGKPAPDLFLEAARLVGAYPEECIGIEDSLSGIEAINAAWMVSVGVGDVDLLRSHGAHIVFADTSQMTFRALEASYGDWQSRSSARNR